MNLPHKSTKRQIVHEKTSALLKRASLELGDTTIQIGVLLYRLRRRSFGGVLLFLAILGLVPGVSIFSGLVMVVLGLQLSFGFRSPRLPRVVSEYCLSVDRLKSALNRIVPKIEKLESHIKPRLLFVTLTPFNVLLGLLIVCLAVLIIIPLPFTNLLPALAVLLISLGLLERDGVFILAGSILALCAFVLGGLVIYLSVQGLGNILG